MKLLITTEQFNKLAECDGCATTTNSGNYAYEAPFGAKPIRKKKKSKDGDEDIMEDITEQIVSEILDQNNYTYTTVANVRGGKRMYNAYNNKEDFKPFNKRNKKSNDDNKDKSTAKANEPFGEEVEVDINSVLNPNL